jgi:hypothetical protein
MCRIPLLTYSIFTSLKVRIISFSLLEHIQFEISATLNNISAISWLLVLLVEKTGVPGENHRPVGQTLSPYHEK